MDRRLALFKALGDNTRYAIYLEIARADAPVSTAEVAEALDLHPNTVRPHLERMREVGLLEVEADSKGSVGRPQHRWTLAAEAPSLGLEPSAFRLLATLLSGVAAEAGAAGELCAAVGRQRGRMAADEQRADEGSRLSIAGCLAGLVEELTDLGFDPVTAEDGDTASVAFTRCPYSDLAEAFPQLICHLHRGIVEGFVQQAGGGDIEEFHTIEDRDPCRVELALR